ncbi:MAG: hypothetical protein GX592_04825 [Clostridiales bacterium]|nr:hypothetical protein [Clostridiales bacterium]
MEARILVFDLGTTALKAVLYDAAIRPIGEARREWVYAYPRKGFIEHEPEEYWRKCVSAANELFDRFGGRETLEGISVTGQSETLIALDREGRELGSAIVWLDTRGESELPGLSEELGADALYEATGNTGLDPVMPLLKLPWMRRNEPERYEAAEKFLLIKEYIVYRLTREIVAEHSAQSCSGYFNIRTLDWEDNILRAAGIDRSKLPEPADSQHVVGGLSLEARRLLGLPDGVRVVNGLLDQCASGIGAGAIDARTITETTGTVLAIGAALDAFEPEKGKMLVLRHGLPGKFMALPNCSTAGVLLKWFRDNFLPAGTDYASIDRGIVARGRPDSGLIVLPHFAGYLTPVNNPKARGVIYGLTLDATPSDVAHAIMEGVGFLLRENLELLENCGIPSETVVSLGGGANSELWLQIKANICNRPMRTLRESESTALGCALNCALALGRIARVSDMPGYVEERGEIRPDAQGVAVYEQKYRLYRDLNRKLGFNPAEG